MQNLIQFLWRNNVTLFFLLLQGIAFTLIVDNNSYHKAGVINSTLHLVGSWYDMTNDITEYVRLGKENEKLSAENAVLMSHDLRHMILLSNDLHCYGDSAFQAAYGFHSAKVINSTTHLKNNYLILDKGLKDGIELEMGVISGNGVVGIVKDVTDNYSSVISVLHSTTKISAVHRNTGYHGELSWPGFDYKKAQLKDIPNHAKISVGDTIVTRGSGMLYPPKVLLGTVDTILPIPGENFHDITVNLSTDFKQLSHVYIVDYLLKDQQTALEAEFKTDD